MEPQPWEGPAWWGCLPATDPGHPEVLGLRAADLLGCPKAMDPECVGSPAAHRPGCQEAS